MRRFVPLQVLKTKYTSHCGAQQWSGLAVVCNMVHEKHEQRPDDPTSTRLLRRFLSLPSPKEFPPERHSVNMHHNSFMVALSPGIAQQRERFVRERAWCAISRSLALWGHANRAWHRVFHFNGEAYRYRG